MAEVRALDSRSFAMIGAINKPNLLHRSFSLLDDVL